MAELHDQAHQARDTVEPIVNQQSVTSVEAIGRATEEDIREALHQVIDPELGIDVIDLGLVYGIEVDQLGRAILTMTLTTPACPLTDLIEDECASALAGLVDEFRIDWTWKPRWSFDNITEDGRAQLEAMGFNVNRLPSGMLAGESLDGGYSSASHNGGSWFDRPGGFAPDDGISMDASI